MGSAAGGHRLEIDPHRAGRHGHDGQVTPVGEAHGRARSGADGDLRAAMGTAAADAPLVHVDGLEAAPGRLGHRRPEQPPGRSEPIPLVWGEP